MKANPVKANEVLRWMSSKDNYKNGVTLKELKEYFGSDYEEEITYIKRCDATFFENGKWHTCHNFNF